MLTIQPGTSSSTPLSRVYGPPAPPSQANSANGPSGREIVDRHSRGDKTDVKAVAADLKHEIAQRPHEATKLTKEALEQVKADDRDELAQEFLRTHSDDELKALGATQAGKGALALAVNELAKGKVHKDEANDARRVGTALGVEVDIKVNAGWSWERVSGVVHTVLDIAGFIPGLGAIPDLINAGLYAAEGDWKNAALSSTAAIPLAGDAVKGTSMVVKGGKELFEAGAKKAVREGAESAGEKAVKEGLEAAGKQGDEAIASTAVAARAVSKEAQTYADLVKSNKPWSWANDFPGGANLSAGQKAKIKKEAVDAGLIPDVRFKPGTKFPDFQAAGLVYKTDQLPKDLWTKGDKAQFDWLDNRIPGGRPEGYTWHHSDVPGRMELVPFGPHNIINHQGGRSPGMWADAPR